MMSTGLGSRGSQVSAREPWAPWEKAALAGSGEQDPDAKPGGAQPRCLCCRLRLESSPSTWSRACSRVCCRLDRCTVEGEGPWPRSGLEGGLGPGGGGESPGLGAVDGVGIPPWLPSVGPWVNLRTGPSWVKGWC